MREQLINIVGRTAGDKALNRIPIEAFPPYGEERKQFFKFLDSLPDGGLGFHATSSNFADSIIQNGLNPKFAPNFSFNEIYYILLHPPTDSVLKLDSGIKSKIATYHRLINGLKTIIPQYGISNADKYNLKDPMEKARTAIVVISDAWNFATVTHKEDERFYKDSPYYKSREDYEKYFLEGYFKSRMFYSPWRISSPITGAFADDLRVCKADKIPTQNIVEVIALDLPQERDEFPDSAFNRYLNVQAHRVVKRIIDLYASKNGR